MHISDEVRDPDKGNWLVDYSGDNENSRSKGETIKKKVFVFVFLFPSYTLLLDLKKITGLSPFSSGLNGIF